NVIGTEADDTIAGDNQDNIIAGRNGDDELTGNGGDDDFLFVENADFGDTITDFSTGAGNDDEVVLDVDTNSNITNGAVFTMAAAGTNSLNLLNTAGTTVNATSGSVAANFVLSAASLAALTMALTGFNDATLNSANNSNFVLLGLSSGGNGNLFGFEITPVNGDSMITANEFNTLTIAQLDGVMMYNAGDIFIA
ncbi:MAG: hypothetical protein GVY17_13605, partial [Cyanobacteria bacterium]|nr:hypothetical protein [Cyanobacteria bacterium GSL.Bin21]